MNEMTTRNTLNLATGESIEFSNVGLDIPPRFSLDALEEVAERLGAINSGQSWAAGDAYLAAEKHGQEAAERIAAKMGMKPKTVQNYAYVCDSVVFARRRANLNMSHYQEVMGVADDMRESLLDWACSNGKPPVSQKALREEKNRRLGIEQEKKEQAQVTGDTKVDRALDSLVSDLPKATATKVRKKAVKVTELMQEAFSDEVRKEADRIYRAKHADRIAEGDRQRAEAKEAKERYDRMAVRVDAVLSEDEFKLIRMCLHPDRAPEDRREQFARAFALFNKMADRIPRGEWAA